MKQFFSEMGIAGSLSGEYLEASILLAQCGAEPRDVEDMCKLWIRYNLGKEE